MADLRDLVVVLTGATSGIGRATAFKFAQNNAKMLLAARSEKDLEELSKKLGLPEERLRTISADVSNLDQVESLAEAAVNHFGRIDVWINNAAVTAFGQFEDIPIHDMKRILEVNLWGCIYGARVAVRQFRKQGQGTLINIASVAGVVGQPFSVPYSISKFGIRGLSISLEQELKAEKDIHVCTVIPSTIDTPIYAHAANYTGKRIIPPVKVSPADKVAEVLLDLSQNPEKKTYVGKSTNLMRLGKSLFPNLFDKYVYYTTRKKEFGDEQVEDNTGNLYEPSKEKPRIDGGWAAGKKNRSLLPLTIGIGLITGIAMIYTAKK